MKNKKQNLITVIAIISSIIIISYFLVFYFLRTNDRLVIVQYEGLGGLRGSTWMTYVANGKAYDHHFFVWLYIPLSYIEIRLRGYRYNPIG